MARAGLTWSGIFPKGGNWDDIDVNDEMRRASMAVVHASVLGRKVAKDRLETARFVLGKMVAGEAPKINQVNFINLPDIQRALLKAGSKKVIDVLPAETPKSLPIKAKS